MDDVARKWAGAVHTKYEGPYPFTHQFILSLDETSSSPRDAVLRHTEVQKSPATEEPLAFLEAEGPLLNLYLKPTQSSIQDSVPELRSIARRYPLYPTDRVNM